MSARTWQGHVLPAELLGVEGHQAEVRLDHAVLGGEVPALDAARQVDLLLLGQQRDALQAREEQGERLGFGLLGELLFGLRLPGSLRATRPYKNID